jgi:PAS domain S-box-containing protein
VKYSFFRSIRTQLLILVLLSVIPALGIVIYSGFDRQTRDIEEAKGNALRALQSFASDHERAVESTRQLLMTLAQLPDVRDQNAAACNRLFSSLLKENPVFANIFAATDEGMIFANALPFSHYSVKKHKFFQNALKTRNFSVGEYVIEVTLQKPVLHFAYPITDARGRFKGVVAVAFGLDRYMQMFTKTKLPEDSVLGIYDYRHIRLFRSHEAENYVGKADSPEMVRYMSAAPEEGSFTAVGNDRVKRFMAYRRFYLKGSSLPYLSMRVGIAEKQALLRARNTLFNNVAILCAILIVVMALAWFLGNIIIVRRLKKLSQATRRLGHGDLTARTGLDHREDEVGRLTKSFDEMADVLEHKENDRIQAEKALQESEKRLHSIIQGSPISIFVINNDHNIVYWNKALEELTGVKARDVVGTSRHWKVFYSTERPCLADLLVDQVPGKIPQWYEGKCLKSKLIDEAFELTDFSPLLGDKGKWLRFTAALIRNPRGDLVGAIETIEDITERRLAQMAIQESENKYRTLVENLNVGIYRCTGDAPGRFIQANPAIAKMFGYDFVDDFMEVSVSDLYQNPEDRKSFVEELTRSGFVTGKELRLMKKDGRLIWTSITARAHFDETDGIDWVDGVIDDITERKQSEEALRERDNLFRLLFEKSGDGNLLIDNGMIIDCNEAALRMLDCSEKDALLNRIPSEISPERQPDGSLSSEKELMLLERALNEGYARFEWQHKTFGGRNLFVDAMMTAVPMKGQRTLYTTWRDITDKKIIEQELIHKEKLSSLGMLVSSISHEINNPNNFIIFNIPILREYFRELIPIIDEYAARQDRYTLFGMTYEEFREDVFKLMDNIEHGADRINATVSNLQEFSRKKSKGTRKKIRINNVLDKAVNICRSQINRSVKFFEIHTDEGLPELVTDPEALEQVLINLLINATQAAYKKDSIIKVHLLNGTRRGDDLVIEIMDNGIGFDEQTMSRLFEPFFTTKPIGTGIGLYIVKKIIDDLGGRIEVRSRPGEGSIFRVILSHPNTASEPNHVADARDSYI